MSAYGDTKRHLVTQVEAAAEEALQGLTYDQLCEFYCKLGEMTAKLDDATLRKAVLRLMRKVHERKQHLIAAGLVRS